MNCNNPGVAASVRLATFCAGLERPWEVFEMPVEDGMFIRWANRPVWVPVSFDECVAIMRREADAGDVHCREYLAAYEAGDYERATALYKRRQRSGWKRTPHRVRTSRVRGAFGGHTAAEWEMIVAKHGGRCAQCRKATQLEKDHIIPLCAGGSDMAINLQPLCKSCNSAKSGRIQPGTQVGIFDRVVIRQTQGQAVRQCR